MKTRVISSVIGLILLIAVVLSGYAFLGVVITLLALIGVHEFYNAVGSAGYKPIRIIGYLSCLPILFIGLNGRISVIKTYLDLFKSINYFSLGVFVMILILFTVSVFSQNKYNLNDISLTVFGIFYVAFLFSFIVLTRNLIDGAYFIWLVFIGAWATDTFAYFAGSRFGKTKLLPVISPHKSLEGSIGGVIGCVLLTVLYGFILNSYDLLSSSIPLYHFVIIGVLCSVISQIGDWAASAIKRYVNVKDYGNIMPGHGGILDRFDSIIFVAPVIYFYISFIIVK